MNPLLTVAVVWGVGEAGDESFLQGDESFLQGDEGFLQGDEAARKRKFPPFCCLFPRPVQQPMQTRYDLKHCVYLFGRESRSSGFVVFQVVPDIIPC